MQNRRMLAAIGTALLLLGSGCVIPSPKEGQISFRARHEQQKNGEWTSVAVGASRATFTDKALGATIIMYRFDPEIFSVSFANADPPRDVASWLANAPDDVVVATNGVYFNPDLQPTGFATIQGESIGGAAFDLDKSGLIIFSPEFRIVATKHEAIDPSSYGDAVQSFPFFIIDGAAAISADSGQRARRTFIGEDADDAIYVGAVPEGEVSLFALMHTLLRTGVAWRHVINLDGGPSTGLVARRSNYGDRHNSFIAVPNAFLVKRRAR